MSETYYKFLSAEGRGAYTGCPWRLPDGDRPGAWMPPIRGPLRPDGPSVLPASGYHLCRLADLPWWPHATLYLAEAGEERLDGADHVLAREARLLRRVDAWNAQTQRRFAVACASRVMAFVRRPSFAHCERIDPRATAALAAARAAAEGRIYDHTLRKAETNARAAGKGAGVTWRAAHAARVCAHAAGHVPSYAAQAAAQAASLMPDPAAERRWQAAWIAAAIGVGPRPGMVVPGGALDAEGVPC